MASSPKLNDYLSVQKMTMSPGSLSTSPGALTEYSSMLGGGSSNSSAKTLSNVTQTKSTPIAAASSLPHRRANAVIQGETHASIASQFTPATSAKTIIQTIKELLTSKLWLTVIASTESYNTDECEIRNQEEKKAADSGTPISERRFLPHERRQIVVARVISYCKLRRHKEANMEIELLGDLNDAIHTYEQYAEIYPSLSGSFIPFTLRVLQAELASLTGNIGLCLDLLFSLKTFVEQQTVNSSTAESSKEPSTNQIASDPLQEEFGYSLPNDVNLWQRRRNRVTMSIATQFLAQKEYIRSFEILEKEAKLNPNDVELLSAYGRCMIELCNFDEAEKIFNQAASVPNKSPEALLLVDLNAGLAFMVREKYSEAIEIFQKVVDSSVQNVEWIKLAAINNQSVCHLYNGSLRRAVVALEQYINSNPAGNLHETIVFNLCTMYDLESDNATAKKKSLSRLVQQYGGHGFDMSVLKLPM